MAILAQAPQPTQPDPRAQTIQMVGMLVLMGVMFYFLMIRPQQKKAKEHAALLKSIKSGDKILTSGGIVGIVVTVKEKVVTIRSADTKLEVTKSAIAEITERGGQSSE
jgi:preprotein translocase subunit YajC